jgi:hypothetical protein
MIMNGEFVRIYEESVMAYFKVLSNHSSEENVEN